LQHPETGNAIARVLDPAQDSQNILDMGRIEELEATELDERDIAARQLDLERARMARGAEQHRLLLERRPRLARFKDGLGHITDLV